MKLIKRDKTFEKHYRLRIKPSENLERQFKDRLQKFIKGELGYPLYDHALHGKLEGSRAFSITGDIRVIYIELDDMIVFLDIGNHNQVYGG